MADTTHPLAQSSLKDWVMSPIAVACFALLMVLVWDPGNLWHVIVDAATSLAGTVPYILFAVVLLAYLKATGAEVLVARAFQGRENRMIVMAALFGGLAPFCSCEVIPFIAGLLALGAPITAVMAFWLASPLIDPPTLFITAAALGWHFALGKAVAAVAIGLFGGFMMKAAMAAGGFSDPLKAYTPGGCCSAKPNLDGSAFWRFWEDAPRRVVFRTQFVENAIFLFKWLTLAYVLEVLLIEYIPSEQIAALVGGDGAVPIATAALVGMPAYLNSYVAPPMLAGLIEQGMSNGAAMSFMVAGSISCVPAMAAVWALVKPNVFAAYVALGFVGAVLAGLMFQMV